MAQAWNRVMDPSEAKRNGVALRELRPYSQLTLILCINGLCVPAAPAREETSQKDELMSVTEPTPPETARWAARAGLRLPAERHAEVAAVAHRILSVVSVLRDLDFGDLPPAPARPTAQEKRDAAV